MSENDITITAKSIGDGGKKRQKLDEVDLEQMSLMDTLGDDTIIQELRELDLGNLTPI